MIHALIELLAGLVAMMAAAALSPFGVDLNPSSARPEVQRVGDCAEARPIATVKVRPAGDC